MRPPEASHAVVALELHADLVVFDPQIAVFGAKDGVRHDGLHFLRDDADKGFAAAVIDEAVEAETIGHSAQQRDAVFQPEVRAASAAMAADHADVPRRLSFRRDASAAAMHAAAPHPAAMHAAGPHSAAWSAAPDRRAPARPRTGRWTRLRASRRPRGRSRAAARWATRLANSGPGAADAARAPAPPTPPRTADAAWPANPSGTADSADASNPSDAADAAGTAYASRPPDAANAAKTAYAAGASAPDDSRARARAQGRLAMPLPMPPGGTGAPGRQPA